MAKDLELEKNSPDDSSDKAKKSTDDNSSKDKKKQGKKKKGLVKYFEDAISELKKVVWPTPKETTHNTIVVLVMCALAAVLIFGIDSLFGLLNGLLFH